MERTIERLNTHISQFVSTSWAFMAACIVALIWLFAAGLNEAHTRPGTFIIELVHLFGFILLFIVQRDNNKDLRAMHLKLDELIATNDGANNNLIKAEEAPEDVVEELHNAYSDLSKSIEHPTKSMSVDPKNIATKVRRSV